MGGEGGNTPDPLPFNNELKLQPPLTELILSTKNILVDPILPGLTNAQDDWSSDNTGQTERLARRLTDRYSAIAARPSRSLQLARQCLDFLVVKPEL